MAAGGFDPYHKWLGIPPEEQPPTHYRLLGIAPFEADRDVIANAASRQAFHLRQRVSGAQGTLARRLLEEVAVAKGTLLDPVARAEYDRSLNGDTPEFATEIVTEIASAPTFRKKRRQAKPSAVGSLVAGAVPTLILAGALVYYFQTHGGAKVSVPGPAAESLRADAGAELTSRPSVPQPAVSATTSGPRQNPPADSSSESESDVGANTRAGPSDSAGPATSIAARNAPAADMSAIEAVLDPVSSDDPAKHPVPGDEDLAQATKRVRAEHKSEFAKAKTAEQKSALAKTLCGEARRAAEPVGGYALSIAAIELAASAGDFALALDGWKELGERFKVDVPSQQWALLEKSAKTKRADARCEALRQLAADAAEHDRFDLARQALDAWLASKPGASGQITAERQRLDDVAERSAAARAAFERLKTDASDAAANQALGEFLCFVRLEWEQGLPLLGRGQNNTLRRLAEKELARPGDSTTQLQLADAWWDFGEEQSEVQLRSAAKGRARFWYMEALPELSGDALAKAERRSALEARVHGSGAAGDTISPRLLQSKFHGKAAYDAEMKRLTLSYDFQDPAQAGDFEGESTIADGEIAVGANEFLKHRAQFKTFKLTGTVAMQSKSGEIVRGSAGLVAHRDGPKLKLGFGSDSISGSEHGPADEDLVLPLEVDVGEQLVLFRLGNEVVGKQMSQRKFGQLQLCGGEGGARFTHLELTGEPDPAWLAGFFDLPKPAATSDAPSSLSAAQDPQAAKAKPTLRFERIAKIVLWNEHNSIHHNNGAKVCNVALARSGKTVWQKKDLEIPWEADQPTKLAIDVPAVAADSVRVEFTAWHGDGGGLAEVEVLDKSDKNLALGAVVIAGTEHRAGDPRNAQTLIDGITDSQAENVGYWLSKNGEPGWAEIRLLPVTVEPTRTTVANSTPASAKQLAKTAEKPERKEVDAKIYACADDAFIIAVNGVSVLRGQENELFSASIKLARGDVIAVKATNDAGRAGFCCLIALSNGQMITTSDGWSSYLPDDATKWAEKKQIVNLGPVVPGDTDWGMSQRMREKWSVDAAEIWGPGGPDTSFLVYVVDGINLPKKKAAQ
ncbi:MAG TPA: hypothetical protein VMF30_02030 [Pirellulales bacterium]|nr:hypothetical protein [Pirellulales bacterium]